MTCDFGCCGDEDVKWNPCITHSKAQVTNSNNISRNVIPNNTQIDRFLSDALLPTSQYNILIHIKLLNQTAIELEKYKKFSNLMIKVYSDFPKYCNLEACFWINPRTEFNTKEKFTALLKAHNIYCDLLFLTGARDLIQYRSWLVNNNLNFSDHCYTRITNEPIQNSNFIDRLEFENDIDKKLRLQQYVELTKVQTDNTKELKLIDVQKERDIHLFTLKKQQLQNEQELALTKLRVERLPVDNENALTIKKIDNEMTIACSEHDRDKEIELAKINANKEIQKYRAIGFSAVAVAIIFGILF